MANISKIKSTYDEIKAKYKSIISNSSKIGDMLGHFVVNGKSIGDGVYNDDNFSFDIEFPREESPFKVALGAIENDIDDISKLNNKIKKAINMCLSQEENTFKNKLKLLQSDLGSMIRKREGVYNKLKNLSDEVHKNNEEEFNKDGKQNNQSNGMPSGGGGGQPKQNNQKVELSNTFANLANTYKNVKSYEDTVANKLSNIIINGKPIGADYFNCKKGKGGDFNIPSTVEIIDAYDAVIDDVSNLTILKGQYDQAITDTLNEIAALKLVKPKAITSFDEKGNEIVIGYDYREYNAAQLRIKAAQAELKEYRSKSKELAGRISDVKKVQSELENYINALSKANPEFESSFNNYLNGNPEDSSITPSEERDALLKTFGDDKELLSSLPDSVISFINDNPNVDINNTPLNVLKYLASHPNVDPTLTLNYYAKGREVLGDTEYTFVTDNYERIINGKVIWFYKDGKNWSDVKGSKSATPVASGFVLLPGNNLEMYASENRTPGDTTNKANRVTLTDAINNTGALGGNAFGLPNGITYYHDKDGNVIFAGEKGSPEYNKIKNAMDTARYKYTDEFYSKGEFADSSKADRGIKSLSTLCMGENGLYTIEYDIGESFDNYAAEVRASDPKWACLGYYNIVNEDGTFNEAYKHDSSQLDTNHTSNHRSPSYLLDNAHTRSFVAQTDSGLVVMASTTGNNKMYCKDEYNLIHNVVSDNINLLVNGDGGSSTYQLYYAQDNNGGIKLTANSKPTSDAGYSRNNWLIVGPNG